MSSRAATAAVVALAAVAQGAVAHGAPEPAAPRKPIGCHAPGARYVQHVRTARKLVALTFDDGPTTYTPRLLDVLERKHVPASFFLVGRQIASHTAIVRRELRDGDMVGNHTWSHASLPRLSSAAAREQLTRTSAAIRRASGFTPCLFRPPYGDVNRAVVQVGRTLGMRAVGWDTDPRDWAGPPSAQTIWRRVTARGGSSSNPGARSGSIVLMHDGGGNRSATVAAVPRIVDSLRRRGYRLVTLDELIGARRVYSSRQRAGSGP